MDSIENNKKQQEEILELIRLGKIQAQIAEIMQVSIPTINKLINKIDPQKVKEAKDEANKRKEEKILELIRNGKTQTQIAEIMQVSIPTINKWIKKIDPQKVKEAKDEANKRKEEKILELIRNEKTYVEMAEIMEVTADTINKWIKKIDTQKVEKVRNEVEQKREEKILKLIEDRKTHEKIADIMNVSVTTINRSVSKIDPQKVKEARNKAKTIERKVSKKSKHKKNKIQETRENQGNKITNIDYKQLKQKLRDHTITQDEIEEYRNYLDDKYDKIELKEVILMSNIYIKTKRTNEAIIFLTVLIENEEMEYLGKERLIEARNATQRIGRIQKAKVLIRENKTTAEIIEKTGLEETEIIRIKNQMQEDIEK